MRGCLIGILFLVAVAIGIYVIMDDDRRESAAIDRDYRRQVQQGIDPPPIRVRVVP